MEGDSKCCLCNKKVMDQTKEKLIGANVEKSRKHLHGGLLDWTVSFTVFRQGSST